MQAIDLLLYVKVCIDLLVCHRHSRSCLKNPNTTQHRQIRPARHGSGAGGLRRDSIASKVAGSVPHPAATGIVGTLPTRRLARASLKLADRSPDQEFRRQNPLAERHLRVMQTLEKHLHTGFAYLLFMDADG
jgi:hypothetical protein